MVYIKLKQGSLILKKLLKTKGKKTLKIKQNPSKIKQKTLKTQNSKEFVLIKSLR